MRVYGNNAPDSVRISSFYPKNGVEMREVRVSENVEQLSENEYVYDEYVFHVEYREDLEDYIRSNLDDWLETGRNMETVSESSFVYHMEEGHMTELAELVDLIYEDDLEVIG